ncbi:MAG: ATP-binding protein [Clostridiales bacterium]|nr:ATP-binding protein [Clostridiales bacterium]
MNANLSDLTVRLGTIAVFRKLLSDNVVEALIEFLDSPCENTEEKVGKYGNFVSKLYENTDNLSKYILNIVTNNENVFVKKIAHGEIVSEELNRAVKSELEIFSEISSVTPEDLKSAIQGYSGFLPKWKTERIDLENEYFSRCSEIGRFGYGIYSKYHMFNVKDGEIVPVKHPDPVTLKDLSGYKRERQAVIDNTKALLAGKPAANILLSGDAGTGKSSTVKAVANEFKGDGLRIIEMRKDQLVDMPAVIEQLSVNPLKFIIFIDDLSFTNLSDNFNALKAILEGSVSAKSKNVVIYATSNRRHIVKESFKERDSSDDIHRNDTIQELMSLSERFGLCITFVKPSKECYLDIVRNIAGQSGLDTENEALYAEAERFALLKGGRSGRIARQFVESKLSEIDS